MGEAALGIVEVMGLLGGDEAGEGLGLLKELEFSDVGVFPGGAGGVVGLDVVDLDEAKGGRVDLELEELGGGETGAGDQGGPGDAV